MAVFIIGMSSLTTLRAVTGSHQPTALIAFHIDRLQSLHSTVGAASLHRERVACYANSAAAEYGRLGSGCERWWWELLPRSIRQAAKRIAESA